ncbi:MAG: TIGR01212 family radical SAM protein [Desulfovibrio sp.]|jgi:radical SAM protein (TIGR01212 family)|nr:TIGR01212 family radical SAM protein [Desulfovibrio sp.]
MTARRARACEPPRWNRLSGYFLRRFGERVRKIPLDAGFSCPNRDGTLGREGCIFCNAQGSGTGLGENGLDLAGQWEFWRTQFQAKGVKLFMAYLQSFSNTYGPIERLAAVLDALAVLPGIVGLSIGTRPDCVDREKLELIAKQPQPERWIEFGAQSGNDATLRRIRRGHDRAGVEQAVEAAAAAGLKVCVHLIAGLPGEGKNEFLDSVRWISGQAVSGVKFHCLYVCRDTFLADLFTRGEFTPISRDSYIDIMADALVVLRPDIIVHRIAGDPSCEELLAPEWALQSSDTGNRLAAELIRRDARQGEKSASR